MAYPQTTFASTIIHKDSLLGRRREAVAANTLLYQLSVLKDTGRYDAFKLGWHPIYDGAPTVWPIPDHLFWDSDVAKWIEGACYFLKQQSLPEVEAAVHELVDMIASAQQGDGYLNIHYTVVEPGKRFTNLRDMHELYNAGHLIEAALAHHDLYGNDKLLGPITKYVALLARTFGPADDQIHGYPGHPEIELTLLRLFERTREPTHLQLARYFITERGNPKGVDGRNYFIWEAQARGDDPNKRPAYYPEPESLWYHQAHVPIAQQTSIEGHAVRAMYLLTAVADLCRIESDATSSELLSAVHTLWNNMVSRKMYMTGGIGAIKQWEGFGKDYFLPQSTDEGGCYSETCAAIGVMMLAQRMLQIDRNAELADIMELCLYNAVLTSMSYDGKSFTYENHLASCDETPSKREEWFTVACCPPNVLRLLGSLGGYIWTQRARSDSTGVMVSANLYVSSTLNVGVGGSAVTITQQSEWPWSGDVDFQIDRGSESVDVDLELRVPQWATSFHLDPPCPAASLARGYLHLPHNWLVKNPAFTLKVAFEPRWVAPHLYTGQRTVALARGPIIYCVEDVDNPWVQDHFKSTIVDVDCKILEQKVVDSSTGEHYISLMLPDGAHRLDLDPIGASPFVAAAEQTSSMRHALPIDKLHFIPYYFRSNRAGKGHMRVALRCRA